MSLSHSKTLQHLSTGLTCKWIHYYYFYIHCIITAFGEAVGDVIALSVMTPEHMRKINLIKDTTTDDHGKGLSV